MLSLQIKIIILIIVLVLLLLLITIVSDDNNDGDEDEREQTIYDSYLSISGHNVDRNTIGAYDRINQAEIETPEQDLLINNMLLNIEDFNLHDNRLATRRRERMMDIIRNHTEAVAVHIPFILDNALAGYRNFMEPFATVVHLPVEERIVNHVDNQNVHDTAVNNSVRNMVERLLEKVPDRDFESAKNEVSNFVLNYKYDNNISLPDNGVGSGDKSDQLRS